MAVGEIMARVWDQLQKVEAVPVERVTVLPTAFDMLYDNYPVQGSIHLDFVQESSGWKFASGVQTAQSAANVRLSRNGEGTVGLFASVNAAFKDLSHWLGKWYADPVRWDSLTLEVVGDLFARDAWQVGTVAETTGLNVQMFSTGLNASIEHAGIVLLADPMGWRHTSGQLRFESLFFDDWQTTSFDVNWALAPDAGTVTISGTTVRDFAESIVLELDEFTVNMKQGDWQMQGRGKLELTTAFKERGRFDVSGTVTTEGRYPELRGARNLQFHFQGATGSLTAGPVDWAPGKSLTIPISLKAIDIEQWMAVLPPQQFALNGYFNGNALLFLDQGRIKIQSAVLTMDPAAPSRFQVTDEHLLRDWVGMIGGPPALRGQILEAMAGGIRLSRSTIVLERLAGDTVSVRLELAGEARGKSLIVPIGGKTITNNFEGDSFARLLELWGLGWLH